MSKSECIKLLREIFPDVSHETEDKLSRYVDLLLKWNKKINLISENTISDLWMRHILDSAQVAKFIINKSPTILDIGSGAGLPGIILSILGMENMLLLDSDQRKCSFLIEVTRLLELKVRIINSRIENFDETKVGIIISRGFTSINNIFVQTQNIKWDKMLLFKGKNYKSEIVDALQKWDFEYITYPSVTNCSSYILDLTNVRKK